MEEDDQLKEHLDMMNPERVERDKFLDIISQIESSGGKNTDHPEITSGIHKGESALGQYGLMPNTVRELLHRRELAGQPHQPASEEASMDITQNPQLEHDLASQLAQKVLGKFPNEEMAAYSWNQGHNLTPEQVEQRDYLNSPYVQKFQAIKKSLGYGK